ncbi:hypothetical protein [Microbacterium trichothecenolyticum]|uniref:Uncharacterized protein n=1 Tax=Microbacterium trichothecenolyticum TaxID=69370 RepID=A0A0M2HMC6_MICTR|nr:hypothetical protein [Microbacterium trichothecenolyticum]KJL45603.1 hypothetical protein RS82_00155 [Microbacterium trichothecenolyticum]
MEYELPHDTPEPTDPRALNGGHDLIFRSREGESIVLHRPQIVGMVVESTPFRDFYGTHLRSVVTTRYAIVRLNPLSSGVVTTMFKPGSLPAEPTPIFDRLAKERAL